jgi:hypothetical protein
MSNPSYPCPETIRSLCGSFRSNWDANTATKRRAAAAARQFELAQLLRIDGKGHNGANSTRRTAVA